MDVKELTEAVDRFAEDREWQRFHSPKNLSMALTVEASELLELFQWMTEDASRRPDPLVSGEIADEIGDVLIYLIRLSSQLGIDPIAAAAAKLEKNRLKYPVEKSRGNARKYTEFGE